MTPDAQSYYSTVQSAILFPNRINQRDNCIMAIAHLHSLHITIMLNVPASIFNRASELFLNQSGVDISNRALRLCLEITASGHNRTTPSHMLMVDSFTIVREIEPVTSGIRSLEMLSVFPAFTKAF